MSVLVEYVHFAVYRTVMYRTALRLPGRKTREEEGEGVSFDSQVAYFTILQINK